MISGEAHSSMPEIQIIGFSCTHSYRCLLPTTSVATQRPAM